MIRYVALSMLAASACATRPVERATRVDPSQVQPRVDEAAVSAAARCLRDDPERIVEMEIPLEAGPRAWVHPYPASPAQRACADEIAAHLFAPPPAAPVRSLVRGDGKMVSPAGTRERALLLRSRLVDQSAPFEACRREFVARTHRGEANVGVEITIDTDGTIKDAAVPVGSVDDEGKRCVLAATRALVFPPIAGTYFYGYQFMAAGMIISAPDTQQIDPWDLAAALADIHKATDECLALYHSAGAIALRLVVDNNGVPRKSTVERAGAGSEGDEEMDADRCLEKAGRRLRVPPFAGEPAQLKIPYLLR